MFRKESEFKVATAEPSAEELEALKEKFSLALWQHWQARLPNVLMIREKGQNLLYYILSRGTVKSEPGKTTEQLRCMREDFEIFDIVRTVTAIASLNGAMQIDHSFVKVENAKAISGMEAGKIVKRVIEGTD